MRQSLIAATLLIGCWAVDGFAQQPVPPVPPTAMSREALEAEVSRLRTFTQNGAVRGQRPAGCTSAAQRQFDFWLGEWDVSPSAASANANPPIVVAESSISLHAQGCVLQEYWRPFRGAHGHSLNYYDAATGIWHQTYADANGTHSRFEGRLDGAGIMRLDSLTPPPPGSPPGKRRMSFQKIDAETVHQWGEVWDAPSGKWITEWEFIYRRRAASQP